MWHEDDEAAAPAIVISSLGGLVYRKNALTARDICRGRMLRRLLKSQLGNTRFLGSRSFGQAYANSVQDRGRYGSGSDECFANDIDYHHALPPEIAEGSRKDAAAIYSPLRGEHERTTLTQCQSPTAQRKNDNNTATSTAAASTSQRRVVSTNSGRGRTVHGMLAGEWRDRFGRHRRACPTPSLGSYDHAGTAARATGRGTGSVTECTMTPSSICHNSHHRAASSSSYAGTEVSFEGLVDELRARLPAAPPLMESVAKQRKSEEAALANETRGRSGGGNFRQEIYGVDPDRRLGLVTPSIRGAGGGAGEVDLPAGCLRLRRPVRIAGPLAQSPGCLQYTESSGRFGNNGNSKNSGSVVNFPRNAVQQHPSFSTNFVRPEVSFISDGNLFISDNVAKQFARIATSSTNDVVLANSNSTGCSPSAEMVAAAKAQERALPILQVYAVQVVEPRAPPRIGREKSASRTGQKY